MVANWAPRRQMVMQEVVPCSNLKQHVQFSPAQAQQGNKVTRVYYKVLQQHPAFNWLQV